MKPRQLQPLGARVLVERSPHIRKVGLIEVVGGRQNDICVSKVIARGPEVKTKPWDMAVGDHVMHIRVAGVKYDNVLGRPDAAGDWIILREDEIIAVVDSKAVVEGKAAAGEDGSVRVAER